MTLHLHREHLQPLTTSNLHQLDREGLSSFCSRKINITISPRRRYPLPLNNSFHFHKLPPSNLVLWTSQLLHDRVLIAGYNVLYSHKNFCHSKTRTSQTVYFTAIFPTQGHCLRTQFCFCSFVFLLSMKLLCFDVSLSCFWIFESWVAPYPSFLSHRMKFLSVSKSQSTSPSCTKSNWQNATKEDRNSQTQIQILSMLYIS